MSTDTEGRRLNLWIQSLSTEHLLEHTSDELAEAFSKLSNKTFEKIDKKPTIVLPRTYRDETRIPYDEGFWTPPRSNKSSGGESKGYR